MYSAGLSSGCFCDPRKPLTITAASARTPITPPIAGGHGERPREVSQGTARRGYWTAFSPIFSPAKTTTSTNEITTTNPAATKYRYLEIGRS